MPGRHRQRWENEPVVFSDWSAGKDGDFVTWKDNVKTW